jgi:hypothetical protein
MQKKENPHPGISFHKEILWTQRYEGAHRSTKVIESYENYDEAQK